VREQYDFSKAQRGAVIPSPGKTRITIMLDDDVLAFFRAQAETTGSGYQTLVNAALRAAMQPPAPALTVADLRKVLREELRAA
jgi:uncharacterized protein (DUF4415 family)